MKKKKKFNASKKWRNVEKLQYGGYRHKSIKTFSNHVENEAVYELCDITEIKVFCAANEKNQHEELHGCSLACTCEQHKNCFMD